jgi:hypothetical protein
VAHRARRSPRRRALFLHVMDGTALTGGPAPALPIAAAAQTGKTRRGATAGQSTKTQGHASARR